MVLDESHFDQVKRCLPDDRSYYLLPLRKGLPIIANYCFFLELLKAICRYGVNYSSLIIACLNTIKPKVVISIIDNSFFSSVLSQRYKMGKVFLIQNGIRHKHSSAIEGWLRSGSLPVLFSFGEYEKDFIDLANIKAEKVIPIGSLKGSAFINSYGLKLPIKSHKPKYDICFISQFRKGLVEARDSGILDHYFRVNKDLLKSVGLACEKKSLNLAIAMSYDENHPYYKEELSQLKATLSESCLKNTMFFPNETNELRSYQIAHQAKLVIAVDSTLSFEMFGMGMRVLFGGSADKTFEKEFGLNVIFDKIPCINKVSSFEDHIISAEIDGVLSIDDSLYYSETREARRYFMNFSDDESSELIKKHINEELR